MNYCLFPFLEAQAAPDKSICTDTLTYQHTIITCTPNSDCTGLTCLHAELHSNVSVFIDRCTDPLQYHLTVASSDTGAAGYSMIYNTSNTTDSFQAAGTVLNVGRNASHAHFMVSTCTVQYITKTFIFVMFVGQLVTRFF